MPRATIRLKEFDGNGEWRKLARRIDFRKALDALRIPEIQSQILAFLNLRDICSFGQIHRQLRGTSAEHLDRSYNSLLAKFFDDVENFRDVMRRLQAIISGQRPSLSSQEIRGRQTT
ncbi:hypothetical protein SISNIDRAFT_490528 [Sistotremastrum niveocremeum HHB9708]|uniref:F-box domain-containing protein n=1 Tax=Sistotremastrum niveocremeum HHB9708 TaxID=1314777 RepID=A0A164NT32_9AGAM|nr:hypothetical protein SISNIDRAFT_490528 [Sistotremastrum niveocremeum HHB9708]